MLRFISWFLYTSISPGIHVQIFLSSMIKNNTKMQPRPQHQLSVSFLVSLIKYIRNLNKGGRKDLLGSSLLTSQSIIRCPHPLLSYSKAQTAWLMIMAEERCLLDNRQLAEGEGLRK